MILKNPGSGEIPSPEEIFLTCRNMMYHTAFDVLHNREDAEDAVQETFLKVYEQRNPIFESADHEKAWLIRVTINLTKNVRESAWNRKVVRLDESIVFNTKEENDVYSTVCELPQNYRTVIYLFYYEGYKVKEISNILNKNEGTIKTWLFRAREILKEKLEGGFDNE